MNSHDKILLVDDDSNLLAAYKRTFRGRFSIDVAYGGESGLQKLSEAGPYAIVVADRHMPRMDGIEFLSRVRQATPDTVRVMLTGNADLASTIRVVNEGHIFRFLVKPCPPQIFTQALEDALAQYHLITAEKDLLNKTLSGSIKLLTDVLALAGDQKLSRSHLMREAVLSVTEQLGLVNAWEIHVAVMLAAIGQVTIPPALLVKAQNGQPLTAAEQQILSRLPEVTFRLLSNIPRLEGVARILLYQHKNFDGSGFPVDGLSGEEIPLGARLLKILSDLIEGPLKHLNRSRGLDQMQASPGRYDPRLLAAVRFWCERGQDSGFEPSTANVALELNQLTPGMVLRSDVQTEDGIQIVPSGTQLDPITLERVRHFDQVQHIQQPILVAPDALPA